MNTTPQELVKRKRAIYLKMRIGWKQVFKHVLAIRVLNSEYGAFHFADNFNVSLLQFHAMSVASGCVSPHVISHHLQLLTNKLELLICQQEFLSYRVSNYFIIILVHIYCNYVLYMLLRVIMVL